MSTWVWILACALVAVSAIAVVLWARQQGRAPRAPLPSEWALTPRPVFSNDERRIFALLLEALPEHVILAKLPLVRFCFPSDPTRVRYWFDLLGSTHVAFAVCSASGRVIAAIDVESPRRGGGSGRSAQIKQAVLNACRVRYLRLASDAVPSLAELQMLVPPASSGSRRTLHEARDTLATTVASRRAGRNGFQDSMQDSFFAPDTRMDAFASSGFGTLSPGHLRFPDGITDDDIAGVVVDPATRPGGG